MNTVNFYSLCRSGHHAVIYWVLNNLGGVTEKYKDVWHINKDKEIYYYNNVTVNTVEHIQERHFADFQYPVEYFWLIKNHEDVQYIPAAENFTVVRDFLNMICSRYKKWGDLLCWDTAHCISDIHELIVAWKQHHSAPSNNIINYNLWVIDKNYRDIVSQKIGVANLKDEVDYVPNFAKGSSFIGLAKEKDLSRYTSRFQQVKLPAAWVNYILQDKDLLKLNLEIFGIDVVKALLCDT